MRFYSNSDLTTDGRGKSHPLCSPFSSYTDAKFDRETDDGAFVPVHDAPEHSVFTGQKIG